MADQPEMGGEDNPNSLEDLPLVLHRGLAAVATFGFLSFFSSLSLFFFLSYKLVSWQLQEPLHDEDTMSNGQEPDSPRPLSVNGFLVPEAHLCPQKDEDWVVCRRKETFWERLRREPPNQFLMLIYNLLFADIQQAIAFMLNVAWLTKNKIEVPSGECWAQGWFVSVGDLASSVFITAIAIHTYLGVVKGYRLPTWAFYAAIGFCWTFTYGMALLAVIATGNGADVGGSVYVRAGAWCWIHSEFQALRLYCHYLWIFLSLFGTSVIYLIIFNNIQQQTECMNGQCPKKHSPPTGSQAHYPNPDPNVGPPGGAEPLPPSIVGSANSSSTTLTPGGPLSSHPPSRMASRANLRTADSDAKSIQSMATKTLPPPPKTARERTFLLYPLIYVVCTAPLAAGRIASMAGNNVPLSYFCFAGALIACNGWLDVLLYSTTRRGIVFSSHTPGQEVGLATFAFMRTPPNRRFGNVVFVSGGVEEEGKASKRKRWEKWSGAVVEGAKIGKLGTRKERDHRSCDALRGHGMGKGEVMGMAIQMETTTTVVVEVEGVGVVAVEDEKKVIEQLEEVRAFEERRRKASIASQETIRPEEENYTT